jgi:hypothetical protein
MQLGLARIRDPMDLPRCGGRVRPARVVVNLVLMLLHSFQLLFGEQHSDGNLLVGYTVLKELPDFIKRVVLAH